MHISKKETYTLVRVDESSFSDFRNRINEFASGHLVLEVSEKLNIDNAKISLFLDISTNFKSNGMSFVVIKSDIDIDDFPESINIVPTLHEAEDVLKMEAIERDLGF